MAKVESSFKNMVVVLTLISAIAAFALGGVYSLTKGPIEISKKAKISGAIQKVIQNFDSIIDTTLVAYDGGDSIVVHRLSKAGNNAGQAIETYTKIGYSGYVSLMVGILPDGSISTIEVLNQKETPGLGTKMCEPKFKNQFNGLKSDDILSKGLKVKKDGGSVDAITAATISSRAFCDAVIRAIKTKDKGGIK